MVAGWGWGRTLDKASEQVLPAMTCYDTVITGESASRLAKN